MPPSVRRRETVFRYAPALLLSAVASFHHYRISVSEQSAWGAGAGFAMFSTIDSHATRTLRTILSTSDGALTAIGSTDSAWLVRVLPTQANMEALADELLEAHWTRIEAADGPHARIGGNGGGHPLTVARVEVQLWKRSFDPTTGQVRVVKARTAVSDAPETER